MRARRPLLALALLALTIPAAAAGAADLRPLRTWSARELDARYTHFREVYGALYFGGADERTIAARLAAEFHMVALPGNPLSQRAQMSAATTTAGMTTIPNPSIIWDSETHHYVVTASARWNNCPEISAPCWHYDVKGGITFGSTQNVGGYDGFLLRTDHNVMRNVNLGMSRFNNTGQSVTVPISTNSSAGGGAQDQDKWTYSSVVGAYNWDHVLISWTIDMYCGSKNFYSQITHTWSSTTITGFGVSTTGFSVQWSSENKAWSHASQALYTTVC